MAKISDLAGNFLVQTFTPPDLSSIVVDGTTPKVSDLTIPTGTKLSGNTMSFVATLTQAGTVNASLGTPAIILNINGVEKYALYASGSGSTSLTFSYTIEPGLFAPSGTVTVSPSIQMRGGTIKSASGNNLVPLLKVSNVAYDGTTTVTVDSLDPVITSIGCKPSIYVTDQVISFKIRTNKNITVTGTPHLGLSINGTSKYASYVSGSGTKELLFQYTVVSGDSCSFTEFSLGAIDLNTGTMKDANTTNFSLSYTTPNVRYYALNQTPTDIIAPEIIDITMPADGTYSGELGGVYNGGFKPISSAAMTVTFNKPVKVHSWWWMEAWRVQPVVDGTNAASSTTLNVKKLGSYGTIPAGTRFALNGGSATVYTVTEDAAVSSHIATLTITPALSEQANDNQILNDEFDNGFGLTPFVTTSASAGATSLQVNGLCYDSGVKMIGGAMYTQPGDQFTLNGHTYSVDNNYSITNGAATISFTPPLVTSAAAGDPLINAHSGRYWADEYNAALYGIPINTNNGLLAYAPVSGMGTDTWIFEPLLSNSVQSATFTSFKTNQSGGWNILKPASNVTSGNLYYVDLQRNILNVATGHYPTLPTITGIGVTTARTTLATVTLPAAKNYISGEEFQLTLNFDGNVTVSNGPYIELELGVVYDQYSNLITPGTPEKLYYISGSGTTDLVFGTTVPSTWNVPASQLGYYIDPITYRISRGGTWIGANHSDANLLAPNPTQINGISFNNVTNVDIPFLVSANDILPTDKDYTTDQDYRIGLAFNEPIFVTGQPYIELLLNGVSTVMPFERTIDNHIYFKYKIKPTDTVQAGKLTAAASIVLNSGTILDSGSNAPTALNFSWSPSALVSFNAANDSTAATPQSFTFTQWGTPTTAFSNGSSLSIQVNFNKTVVIDTTLGVPYINMDLNGTTIQVPFDPNGGTTTISPNFTWTVDTTIAEKTQVSITSPIVLSGGTIKGYTDNVDAVLTFSSPNTSDITVNTIVPLSISNMTIAPTSGVVNTGEKIKFHIIFNELAKWQGFESPGPSVQMSIGGTARSATFARDNFGNTSQYNLGQDPGQGNAQVGATWIECEYTIGSDSGSIADIYFAPDGMTTMGNSPYGITNANLLNPTTNSIDISNASYKPDVVDFFVGWQLRVQPSATYIWESHPVTAYDYTTKVVSVGTTFNTTPSSYNSFTLTPPITLPDVSSIQINAASPTIVSATPNASRTYTTGENFDITLVFSEAVTVHGTPNFLMYFGARGRYPSYHSGSGTDTLVFRVAIGADISAGYGTVHKATETGYTGLLFTNTDYLDSTATPGIKVFPTTLPSIDFSGIRVNHTDSDPLTLDMFGGLSGNKLLGNTITLTAYTSEAAAVITSGGTPYVEVTMADTTTREFAYTGGTGTPILTFAYTVVASDYAFTPTFGPIVPNGGTIKDVATGAKDITTTLAAPSYLYLTFKILTLDPAITSVTAPAGTYHVGDSVVITLHLNENVDCLYQFQSRLNITLNSVSHSIPYKYDSGDSRFRNYMAYEYVVQPGDAEPLVIVDLADAPEVLARFVDGKNTELNPAITPPDLSSVVIDTTDSKFGVTSWTISPSGTIGAGDTISLTMHLSKTGTVTGSPQLNVRFPSHIDPYLVPYTSGSGTTSLVFSRTAPSVSGTMTIDDVFGQFSNSHKIMNASDTLNTHFWSPTTGITASSAPPAISFVTSSVNGNYTNGQYFRIAVDINRPVTVTGTPKIGLLLNGAFKWASYTGGSGTNELYFDYTIGAEHCPLGTIVCMSNIELNGGSIKDQATPPVNLVSLLFTEPNLSGVSFN